MNIQRVVFPSVIVSFLFLTGCATTDDLKKMNQDIATKIDTYEERNKKNWENFKANYKPEMHATLTSNLEHSEKIKREIDALFIEVRSTVESLRASVQQSEIHLRRIKENMSASEVTNVVNSFNKLKRDMEYAESRFNTILTQTSTNASYAASSAKRAEDMAAQAQYNSRHARKVIKHVTRFDNRISNLESDASSHNNWVNKRYNYVNNQLSRLQNYISRLQSQINNMNRKR